MLNILKSVLEYQKSVWYSEIEVSIGRSPQKAKGMKKEEEKEKNVYVVYGLPGEGKNQAERYP